MPYSSQIRRRSFAAVAAMIASGLAGPGLRAQAKADGGKVTIAVAGKAACHYLPLTIAAQLGYFRAEGLDVSIMDFSDEAGVFQSLGAGGTEVVSGAYEHIINLQGRGQSLQSFVQLSRAPQIALGVSVKTMPGFRAHSELRGKRIGVSAPGSSSHTVARTVLRRAGLVEGDVTYVGVGMAAGALVALRSGQIDAISNVEPVMTMLEQKGEVKIISDTRTLQGTLEVFGGLMPAGCLCAPMEFVQSHPATCQALADAIVRSLKWLRTAGPGDIIRTVPDSYLLGDRSLYLASFNKVVEAFSLDGVMTQEGSLTAFRALADGSTAVRADRVNLAQTFTNQFALRSKERFKA